MEENQQDHPLRPDLQNADALHGGQVGIPLLPSLPQLREGGVCPSESRFTTITGEDWKRAIRIARPRRLARRQAMSRYIKQKIQNQ